jgi:hypothetical protein
VHRFGVVPRWAEPFEEKDGGGGGLHRDDQHQQPRGEVEGLEERCRRDDPRPLRHQNRDPGLEEGHREVDDELAARVDLERGEDHVSLVLDELGDKSVPRAVLHPAPLPVLHPLQPVVEGHVGGELLEQVDAEAGAALEQGGVGVLELLGDVDALQERVGNHLADGPLGGGAGGGRAQVDVGRLLQTQGHHLFMLEKIM